MDKDMFKLLASVASTAIKKLLNEDQPVPILRNSIRQRVELAFISDAAVTDLASFLGLYHFLSSADFELLHAISASGNTDVAAGGVFYRHLLRAILLSLDTFATDHSFKVPGVSHSAAAALLTESGTGRAVMSLYSYAQSIITRDDDALAGWRNPAELTLTTITETSQIILLLEVICKLDTSPTSNDTAVAVTDVPYRTDLAASFDYLLSHPRFLNASIVPTSLKEHKLSIEKVSNATAGEDPEENNKLLAKFQKLFRDTKDMLEVESGLEG